MTFFQIYIQGLLAIMSMMTLLWISSIYLKNVSIVDPFWAMGFIIAAVSYYLNTEGHGIRKELVIGLVIIWGLRLSIYLGWRNWGKGEDYRYQKFRKDYGEHRYWWLSFFQVFLLQGVLCWLVSAPLLAAMYYAPQGILNFFDYMAIAIWTIGFIFEAGGDFQLAHFKNKPSNKGKLLQSGLWKYTRHPNYFGDATIWWSFGLFSVAVDSYLPLFGPILMTWLIVKISGVNLLEQTLKDTKPKYKEYDEKTNAFFPWFPKK
jgi:steroid 5-alpha reductase family enzyme